jgi:hypothetical protein
MQRRKLKIGLFFSAILIGFLLFLFFQNYSLKISFTSNKTVSISSFSKEQLTKMIFKVDENSIVFDPWLNGFPYRKPITISNSGSALTNYQVNVTVDTASLISAGKMRTDCGDIRFTDSDGATLLKYWVESGCNTTSTKIWVKVPSIPAGSKTIYVYYGNPSATSQSNGVATFVVFDDFERRAINGGVYTYILWDRRNNAPAPEQNARPGAIIDTGKLKIWDDTIAYIPGVSIQNMVIEVSTAHVGSLSTRRSVLQTRLSATSGDPGNGVGFGLIYSGDAYATPGRFVLDPSSGLWGTQLVADTTLAPSNTWHTLKIELVGTSGKFYYDGSLWRSVTLSSVRSGPVGLQASYDWHYFDDLRVRKYTSPEPTTSVGTEDVLITQAGSPTSWSWKVPASGEQIKAGSATSWTWKTFTDDGTGIVVPKGSATSWQWGP